MIEKHFNLSCYAMEHPFKVEYSAYAGEIVSFIDSNNDIYQFKLPETELYEKIAVDRRIKQIKHIGTLWLLLDTDRTLVVRKGVNELHRFYGIQEIELVYFCSGWVVLLRISQFSSQQEMSLKIGFISESKENSNQQFSIIFQNYGLKEYTCQNVGFQKYIPQTQETLYKTQKIISNFCLIIDNYGQKFIIKLDFQGLNSKQKLIKYQRLDFELHQKIALFNNFQKIMLSKNQQKTFLIDIEHQKVTLIKELQNIDSDSEYVVYNSFLIILAENNLCIYETVKGSKMAEINIDSLLEEFQQGSTIILKEQSNKQIRYCLLFDKVKSKLTHFYILDKQKLALYHFNINKLLQRGFIKTIKQNLQDLQTDNEKYHQNVMKTINFRIKKIQTLQKYLLQDLRSQNFANTVRFLLNQQNIYVLSDGLSLFYHAIMSNIAKLINKKPIICQLQKDIVKICHRLITESNYQNQIVNGLHILNAIYTNFRKYHLSQALEKNKEGYCKLLQTNRMVKLLKNDKKKRLFELSYELALKVKGYKYLQSLQLQKKK